MRLRTLNFTKRFIEKFGNEMYLIVDENMQNDFKELCNLTSDSFVQFMLRPVYVRGKICGIIGVSWNQLENASETN